MRLQELDYPYPENLIATQRQQPSRVMWVENATPQEISFRELLTRFQPDDVLVINDTKVIKRRIFSEEGLEILFLRQMTSNEWQVLFPASRVKDNQELILPAGLRLKLVSRGRPQTVSVSQTLSEDYFEKYGELPLPPYIQKARGERHTRDDDNNHYQTAWAEKPGSFAAPTASFHFSRDDLNLLQSRGVQVIPVTLHVGLGTFLPVEADDLSNHQMHEEWVEVPQATWHAVEQARQRGSQVWGLGTTSVRALESVAHNLLTPDAFGAFSGATNLFIHDDYQFKVITRLLTNFHQPKTTLLALVAAFAGLETVSRAYRWAIEQRFRLFSYGDLTAWVKP